MNLLIAVAVVVWQELGKGWGREWVERGSVEPWNESFLAFWDCDFVVLHPDGSKKISNAIHQTQSIIASCYLASLQPCTEPHLSSLGTHLFVLNLFDHKLFSHSPM